MSDIRNGKECIMFKEYMSTCFIEQVTSVCLMLELPWSVCPISELAMSVCLMLKLARSVCPTLKQALSVQIMSNIRT